MELSEHKSTNTGDVCCMLGQIKGCSAYSEAALNVIVQVNAVFSQTLDKMVNTTSVPPFHQAFNSQFSLASYQNSGALKGRFRFQNVYRIVESFKTTYLGQILKRKSISFKRYRRTIVRHF